MKWHASLEGGACFALFRGANPSSLDLGAEEVLSQYLRNEGRKEGILFCPSLTLIFTFSLSLSHTHARARTLL